MAERLARTVRTPAFAGDWMLGALTPYRILGGMEREAYIALHNGILETLVVRQLLLGQSAARLPGLGHFRGWSAVHQTSASAMNALDIGSAGSTLGSPGRGVPPSSIDPSRQGIQTVERMCGTPPRS